MNEPVPANSPPATGAPTIVNLSAGEDIAAALTQAGQTQASGNTIFRLGPGDYELTPAAYTDETCGNCQDPQTRVTATTGLRITGRSIALVGDPRYPAILHTHSGYGILFEECTDCRLEGVTVTDGIRDPDANATDAAVVVKRSRVHLSENRIIDNRGDSTLVRQIIVGVVGVAGREGAELTVVDNHIIRNSWDGVALYRGAQADIRNNVIDGVDRPTGEETGGGRGIGISLTWDATADIRGNYVSRYWKGIGVLANARATVEENIVENVATWGLTLWDAGQGHPSANFRWNVVMQSGACGASISRSGTPRPVQPTFSRPGSLPPPPVTPETPAGCLIGNAFLRTGQNPRYDSGEPFCVQTAVALLAPTNDHLPLFFPIEGNAFYRNRESGGLEGRNDQAESVFRAVLASLAQRLQRWPALAGSKFMQEYGKVSR